MIFTIIVQFAGITINAFEGWGVVCPFNVLLDLPSEIKSSIRKIMVLIFKRAEAYFFIFYQWELFPSVRPLSVPFLIRIPQTSRLP